MRNAARAIGLVVFSVLTAAMLGLASAFISALALGATALIVPGTGTPNANIVTNYREHARDFYISKFDPSCPADNSCALNGIDYPASFWPIPFYNWCPPGCDTWNVSVGRGVAGLHTALTTTPSSAALFGYSQGGAVVSNELHNIANDPVLLAKITSVVTIGGIDNPDGGLWSRLGFIAYAPIINVAPGPPMPVDLLPGKFFTVGFQYDPVVYAPLFWGNPIALLNAFAALETVHGYYLTPNGNDMDATLAYGYTPAELAEQMDCTLHKENCRTDRYGNTYIMIPARSLPLTALIMSAVPSPLVPFAKPFIDLAAPTLKVIADLGYDWSGDPSVAMPLSILPFNPFQNWVEVERKLVAATVQGVQAFIADLSELTSGLAPAVTAPLSDTETISALAAPEPAEVPDDSQAVSARSLTPPRATVSAHDSPLDRGILRSLAEQRLIDPVDRLVSEAQPSAGATDQLTPVHTDSPEATENTALDLTTDDTDAGAIDTDGLEDANVTEGSVHAAEDAKGAHKQAKDAVNDAKDAADDAKDAADDAKGADKQVGEKKPDVKKADDGEKAAA